MKKNSEMPEGQQDSIDFMTKITKEVIAAHDGETNFIALNKNIEFQEAAIRKKTINMTYVEIARQFKEKYEKELKGRKHLDLTKLLEAQKELKHTVRINLSLLSTLMK